MSDLENIFYQYRKRKCDIENIKIHIGKLKDDKDNEHLITQMNKKMKELIDDNKIIDNKLNLLTEKEHKIVKLVMIDGIDKKKVSEKIDRTVRQINRILNQAADKML